MSSPLLLLFPPDPKNPILPPHLPDEEEEDVFVVVGLIRGVLRDGNDHVPPPPPPYDDDRDFVLRIGVRRLGLIVQRRRFRRRCRYYDDDDGGG